MSRIRTVFLGTPEFSAYCLKGMLKDEHFEIVAVVTQPDQPQGRKMLLTPTPVKQVALEHHLPLIQEQKLCTEENLKKLSALNAEAAVVVAFGQILSQKFLDLFPRRVVNIHTSLLPRWRGAAPIQRAIMAGDPKTGVTLQVMKKKLDQGDVLADRKVELDDQINSLELLEKLKPLSSELLHIELMDYLRGNLSPHPQDESQVTYAHKIEKSESLLDFKKPALQLSRDIRGLAWGPGSYAVLHNKRIKIHQTRAVESQSVKFGQVLKVERTSFTVACGDSSALEVFRVQPESKPQMSVEEFLKGSPLKVGDSFLNE